MGHFDYVVRAPRNYEDKNLYYKDFSDHFDKIFSILIAMEMSLEINTSGAAYGVTYMDIDILKRYKELGGEMITISSDAHHPDRVGQNFKETVQFIKDAGFSFLTHFDKGKPILESIPFDM